jgi:hypothetical protein
MVPNIGPYYAEVNTDAVSAAGIVGHYNPARISLDGFILDPALAKAA